MAEADPCPGCAERDAIVAALAERIRALESRMNPPPSGVPDAPPVPPPPARSPAALPPAPPAGAKTAATTADSKPATPEIKLDGDTRKILEKMGFPPEDFTEAARALKEHGDGLRMIASFAAHAIHGAQILHAAFAAEKFGKESAERAVRLAMLHRLEGPDIFHAADADRNVNPDCALTACEIGFRKRDILFAAKALHLWPFIAEGKKALGEMFKLFATWNVDIHEEDIRYAATTYKTLGEELLGKALRDRHPKNPRENWLRGVSIPLIAWAYRLDAPHVGQYIEEANQRSIRRERIGQHVIAALGKKRGRELELPDWL
jgi:hypothetical protein